MAETIYQGSIKDADSIYSIVIENDYCDLTFEWNGWNFSTQGMSTWEFAKLDENIQFDYIDVMESCPIGFVLTINIPVTMIEPVSAAEFDAILAVKSLFKEFVRVGEDIEIGVDSIGLSLDITGQAHSACGKNDRLSTHRPTEILITLCSRSLAK